MKNRLEDLVKKHKKAGKPILIGKIMGGAAGVVAGAFIGKEILEFFNIENFNYIAFGIRISPPILFAYLGQKIGGYAGTGYYILNRNNKNNSQSL